MTHSRRPRSFSLTLFLTRDNLENYSIAYPRTPYIRRIRVHPIIPSSRPSIICLLCNQEFPRRRLFIHHSLCLIGLRPPPWKLPPSGAALLSFCRRSAVHRHFVVQHCYRLESICYVAIDLCSAFALRSPFVVLFIRFLVDPISAIPNLPSLTRVHMSSSLLLSCITVHLFFSVL